VMKVRLLVLFCVLVFSCIFSTAGIALNIFDGFETKTATEAWNPSPPLELDWAKTGDANAVLAIATDAAKNGSLGLARRDDLIANCLPKWLKAVDTSVDKMIRCSAWFNITAVDTNNFGRFGFWTVTADGKDTTWGDARITGSVSSMENYTYGHTEGADYRGVSSYIKTFELGTWYYAVYDIDIEGMRARFGVADSDTKEATYTPWMPLGRTEIAGTMLILNGKVYADDVKWSDIPKPSVINANVAIQGLAATADKSNARVKIDLLDSDKSLINTSVVALNDAVTASFDVSKPGTYFIMVSAPKSLTKIVQVDVTEAGSTNEVSASLPAGDINDDGVINVSDYNILKTNWFKKGDI